MEVLKYFLNILFFNNKKKRFEKEKVFKHSGALKISREICIPTFEIENGEYVIIPRYYLKIFPYFY